MIRMGKTVSLIVIASMLALAGCSSNANNAGQGDSAGADSGKQTAAPSVSTAPVTLTFYAHVAELDEDMYQKYIADPVKKEHPNITLENLGKGGVNKLGELVASGTIPDIIFSGSDNFPSLKNVAIDEDLSGLLKKFNVDISTFAPDAIKTLKDANEGRLTALPFSRNSAATFYNKDIFDKFGVKYPTNGMTWDQIIEIGRKLTQKADGVQYIGWEPGFPDANAESFVQPFVDPKTKKALVDTPVYQKVFAMMKEGYDIPGFGGDKGTVRYTPANFIGDKYVGIYIDWYNKMMTQLIAAEAANSAPNWDIVTVPNFPENANKGRHSSIQFLMISKNSKYKDQALQVIQSATSKESQLLQSRNGRISILSDPEIDKQFGKDVPAYADKHMENLFAFKPVASIAQTKYDDEIRTIIRGVSNDIVKKKLDINTALRQAQEAADKKIAEMDAQ
ncbi:MAG: transporter substrate-binding protein [Paenibacillaceae bacterium]|nr:transporter substrate-binding protein [Paenibacillaceae bacterium]